MSHADPGWDLEVIVGSARLFARQNRGLGMFGRTATVDRTAWRAALQEGGWLGVLARQSAGGSGLSTLELCRIAEAFGANLLPPYVPLAAAAAVLGERALAPEAMVMPALQSAGRTPAPGHGSQASLRDDGSLVLNGVKTGVPDGHLASGFIVDAKTAEGLVLVHVPRHAVGVTVSSQAGVDGVDVARVQFNGVGIAAQDVLARGDDAVAALDRLRFSLQCGLAAEAVGVAAELCRATLDYLRTRRAFGRTLGAFQALQHRAVDIYADIELSRALTFEAARVVDAGRPGTLELIAAARAKAGDTALRTAKWAVQMHGAMGFTDECDIGLFFKRALGLSRLYRTPEAHRQRFAQASWSQGAPNLFELFRSDSPDDTQFRATVRGFIATNLPARWVDLPTRPPHEAGVWWHKQLYARGWIAPAWPKEHGGMEASAEQRLILFEELAAAGAPELSSQGIYHIGPILIRYGTPEQKAQLLPGTLSGDLQWCQGYSEPNSGSDLASLRTSARLESGKLIVNGQKTWTTGAQHADWMFALVRTDAQAADRRDGISMILIDMKAKGVRVRPIKTIAGDEEFCEVFFDDVELPDGHIVGGLNEGWKLANAVLETERMMTSSPQKLMSMLDRVRRVAKATGACEDAAFVDRLARVEIDVLAYCAAFAQVLERSRAGGSAGPQVSILKICMADYLQALADMLLEAAGADGGQLEPLDVGGRKIAVALSYLQARRASIYGGSSEIQRNIVARRVLNLGNEPKLNLGNEPKRPG